MSAVSPLSARHSPSTAHPVDKLAERGPLPELPVADPSAPRPYIPSDTPHYAFAGHVAVGYSYADACAALDINPRTAERWRADLCRVAAAFFGREVEYHFVARWVIDKSFRDYYLSQQRVRESPHRTLQTPCTNGFRRPTI